jgi:hypothetical protein
MSLIAHNLTATPLTLAGGTVTLPPNVPVNVTGELRPDLTVDPTNGHTGGLSTANFTSIQAQVDAGSVVFDWTGRPEYLTGTLVVDQPATTNSLATKAAINLYVDATGSDSNPGTQALPLLTIQAALDKVPKTIRHPVTINVGAGNFKGATVDGFSFNAITTEVGAWLNIVGTLVTATVATGVTTGVVASATLGSTITYGTLVCTGAGWTINDLKGKLVDVVISGSLKTTYLISSNTADTITIVGSWISPAPANGSAFALKQWGTGITTPVNPQAAFEKSALSTSLRGFDLLCSGAHTLTEAIGYSSSRINFVSLEFTISGYGISSATLLPFGVIRCKFNVQANKLGIHKGTRDCGICFVSDCYFSLSAGSFGILGNSLFIYGSLFIGSSTGTAIVGSLYSNGKHVLAYVEISGVVLAVSSGNNVHVNLSFCRIYDCATAVFSPEWMTVTSSYFATCGVVFDMTSPPTYSLIGNTSGAGNTIVVKANNGANVKVMSTSTITGTTEISIDGATSDFATMRAATPKYVVNATTGSKVWGD